MRLKFSYILSVLLSAGVIAWMYSGTIVVSGQVDTENALPPPAIRVSQERSDLFKVQVSKIKASDRNSIIKVHGKTEASAKVTIQAETTGMLIERPYKKGDFVEKGEILCQLVPGTRQAQIDEAHASFLFTESQLRSAEKLNKSGFSSTTQVGQLQVNLEAAKSRLEQAKLELERTTIKAPFSGIIETPIAEIGSLLSNGSPCATILKTNPMLAVGQISEREVGQMKIGTRATVQLVNGETKQGKISYIASGAESNTKTFRIEVELPNDSNDIRDGITAQIEFILPPKIAHFINSSTLTLNSDGELGVKTVNGKNLVQFIPVELAGGETNGVWVKGLPEEANVITVGQEYVIHGQEVDPVLEKVEVN